MLLRYFADDGIHDIEVPAGSEIAFRSHVQVGDEAFLDDLLMVPWEGRVAPIPGEVVPALARSGMYGLQLVESDPSHVHPAFSSITPAHGTARVFSEPCGCLACRKFAS